MATNKAALKALKETREELKGEIRIADARLQKLHKEGNKVAKQRYLAIEQIRKVNEEIEVAEADRYVWTDHAFRRYIQRVMGVDLDPISKGITEKLYKQYPEVKDGTYVIDSAKYVVKNGKIVTVKV